jgi:hypothetical protein
MILSCACLGILELFFVIITLGGSWIISSVVQKLHHKKCCGKGKHNDC